MSDGWAAECGYRGQTTGVYPDAVRFFDAVDGKVSYNIAVLAGHCSARASVAGEENRELTAHEVERMLAILEENLKMGAACVSLGLMYSPGDVRRRGGASQDCGAVREVQQAADRASARRVLNLRVLSRASGPLAFAAGDGRAGRIAKGTKLQFSHLIFVGRGSFGDKNEALSIINRMCEEGVQAQFDIYNEKKGVSVITVVLPAWYRGMTDAQRQKP